MRIIWDKAGRDLKRFVVSEQTSLVELLTFAVG